MKTNTQVVQLFSGGKFDEVEDYLAENVEWIIYEENMTINGKTEVLKFCRSVAEYFKTLATKFETFGLVADGDKVAIYGRAEFIREEKTVNVVHSCDVYEFDADGKIFKIYSYCNSKPTEN
ncbi:nuclear transport factor 2 family protein [Mucilaginibacter phyllosphaerae]|uniref:Ketosteroid isomerase-like protein n=1 Tax=Mucilaginibacter phyllosphaerae TaxID=1812349 RepID=A0A4Y8AKC8_9SPHI|nr:nuclear transport factor 2 family protein [Mucilaginibacter phyllosphaerae]MBB3967469.1 ketosteroid isomerase-like protein [Mucilaginibacter phyllosphaerae]TEW69464.1 nuclear transport factor 2 family protein [Mucilaginibacter phyllosphaerae]GGH20890.1 hypothetical protein GCM10007352_33210 [Mucilaginibacter phyllosphaerae]